MRAPHLAKLATLFLPVALCASSVPAQEMYWTAWRSVRRADLNGDNVEVIFFDDAFTFGIALDLVDEKVYWSSPFALRLRRANLDGSDVEDLITDAFVWGVAIDESNRKLYFADNGSIQRANLDGTDVETVLPDAGAYALCLDVPVNKLYWGSLGDGSIMRSNLNGTQIEEVISGIKRPMAITLDRRKRMVYWADSDFYFFKYGRVGRGNFDGTDVEIIVPSALSLGVAVDEIRGVLYFTNFRASVDGIERADLDGSNRMILTSDGQIPIGIALDLRGLPIPAISAWGFVIMGLSIVTIHVAARRRRAWMSAPTEGGS